VEDIQKAVLAVMKNEKKLRQCAALFELNPSAAFCGVQKARNKLGNVESKLMYSCKCIF
jgi:hypothetical protein